MARINYFYFRKVTGAHEDDHDNDSILIPVDSITGFMGDGTEHIYIYFDNQVTKGGIHGTASSGYVRIKINENTHRKVLYEIAGATNGPVHGDGITVIADNLTGTFFNTDIIECVTIASQGGFFGAWGGGDPLTEGAS